MSLKFGVTPVAYFQKRLTPTFYVGVTKNRPKYDHSGGDPEAVQTLEAFLARFKAIGENQNR